MATLNVFLDLSRFPLRYVIITEEASVDDTRFAKVGSVDTTDNPTMNGDARTLYDHVRQVLYKKERGSLEDGTWPNVYTDMRAVIINAPEEPTIPMNVVLINGQPVLINGEYVTY